MSIRQSMAIGITPLLLRLVLGLTFVWAGLGKVATTREFSPELAAVLANAGISPVGKAAAPPEAPVELPAPASESDAAESEEGTDEGDAGDDTPQIEEGLSSATPGVSLVRFQEEPSRTYVPDDFPEGVEMRSVYGIALAVISGADPPFNEDTGVRRMATVPEMFGSSPWPTVLAWAAAITELIAGVAILFGLLSRISALNLAGVMLVAMWLTQIGPAIQMDTAILGFLPGPPAPVESVFEWAVTPGNWNNFLWQLSLFAAAMGVFFGGPGWLSMDRLLFGKPKPAPVEEE